VVNLPDKMIPIIIGDLHAQVDNLLTLLSQNEFLESMGDGKAAVVFLGDAVHKEVDGEMDEMESSLLIMDLIFRLKLWFPQQIFYIRGNHDCFSEDIGKDGIPQGLLWDRAIRKTRGEAYKKEMDRFYDLLPYVALSGDFAACHAAPPKSKVTLDLLINIRRYPGLIVELTCNRLYRPNRPAGYTKGDVKRFRKSLKLAPDSDLFVGHTPLSRQDTLWLDVAGIENHHVVFSGNTPWIGVFTRVGDRLMPLRYRTERLLPIINGLPQED
jgi:predicted phosphodiesterase